MGVVTSAHTPLIGTDDVGWFMRDDEIYEVRWNRVGTARYARLSGRDDATGEIDFDYRGRLPLYMLTPFDKIPGTEVLIHWRAHGPYNFCAFCHNPLSDPQSCAFGVGPECARKHLGVHPKALEAMHAVAIRRVAAPHRHLRLVAVDGRRVA